MSAAVHFQRVFKQYGRLPVLDGVSLEIEPGEFVGLVGINGAGKTTCIKALLNFIDIDSGSIQIFGVRHDQTRAREQLAFLPERFLPPYYLRGRDFLNFYAHLRGSQFTDEGVRAMCEALDLDPGALSRSVRDYSKGMSQKLGLIATFLNGNELLVLDEPMSGLDPKARLLVKTQMQAMKRHGRTVFFSTHMLSDVDELCDRMGILHDGQLRFIGSPSECRQQFGSSSLEQAYLSCISDLETAAS
ncbi:MAG: ABC transporter ATP-binding protein [Gammaproteobacteria bacterium]|nr:ABC transporter ATP-binding protein [Gammaproteobacteria bacterium]MDH3412348.1 ABC transporter ATP-binding protein [Gammaproteobacteria bacterium]